MQTKLQLNEINKEMAKYYRRIYGADVVISPIVIPYDEFKQYQKVLPYYNNILTEGKRIG